MDQEIAKKLLLEGGTFVFLGVPAETQFGIDMQCWNTEEDFRGIKMIPPGLHYLHYSAVSKGTGDVAPRSGFMHYFREREFLVRMWDKNTEDISREEISEESIQRLRDNLLNIDRHLAPYPYEIWNKWKLLTSQITADLAKKLSPETGIIRTSVELLSTTDADRPRAPKATSSDKNEENVEDQSSSKMAEPGSSSEESVRKRTKRLTREEMENSMLPNLKPAPGMSMRFTEIPSEKYPPGATPEEITRHYLDQSYTLELMIAKHDEPLHIIGELQFSFLCFLIGHSLESFEHWCRLVALLCSCEAALSRRALYLYFMQTMEVQLEEMPEEFLADIVMNKNLVYKKLREFFRTVQSESTDARLREAAEEFKQRVTAALEWDFARLDDDDDDERPVVVSLDHPVD